MTLSSGWEGVVGAKRKPFDAVGFLRLRGLVILGVGGLSALALVPVFRGKLKSHYEASGALLVDVSKEITLTGREREILPTNIGDYVRTLVNRISSLDVLGEALREVPEEKWPSFCMARVSEVKNAVALLKNLSVKEEPHSFLITTTLKADAPQGLGVTLNAVMERFLAKLRAEQEERSAHRLTYLRAERARVEERVFGLRNRLMELAERVANKAFLQGSYAVHLINLEQIQKLYWEAESGLALQSGLLEKAKSDQEAISRLSLSSYAEERVAANEGINRIEQWTYEQMQTLRSNIDGLTSKNQDRVYVEERMAAMKAYLEGHKKKVHEGTIRFLEQKRAYDLSAEVVRATSAYEASKKARDELLLQVEEAKREASETGEAIFNASEMTYAVAQLRERLASLNTRIDDCEMEAKSPIKISIDRRASDPLRPARSGGTKALIASVAVGFGWVSGVCLMLELCDGRVRSRRHVEGALGGVSAPSLGGWRGQGGGKISVVAPGGREGFALQSLAVRLEAERKAHGARLILVTGANRGVGATFVGLNLAQAMSGFLKAVLFVEAEPGNGEMDAALEGKMGDLGEVLKDSEGWLEGERARAGPRWLWSQGKGGDMGDAGRFRAFLERSREVFDVVVINTFPLEQSAFAQLIALEADAAVVVVGADVTRYADLVGTLERLRAKPVGAWSAVLNGPSEGQEGDWSEMLHRAGQMGRRAMERAWSWGAKRVGKMRN